MPTSPGPIGTGELPISEEGNSFLTTIDLNGREIKNYLWIDSFTSDLNMEISVAQLKKGLTYRPIRLQERVLTFNTIWNVANRDKYIEFLENIRTHWTKNLNESIPTPFSMHYFGANKTWKGFVLNGSQSYAITDVILRYSFNMKIITNQNVTENATVEGKAPFMPTAEDVNNFGEAWYTQSELERQITENFGTAEEPKTPPLAGAGVKFLMQPSMEHWPWI